MCERSGPTSPWFPDRRRSRRSSAWWSSVCGQRAQPESRGQPDRSVRLIGAVDSAEKKDQAMTLASGVAGVTRVRDGIFVCRRLQGRRRYRKRSRSGTDPHGDRALVNRGGKIDEQEDWDLWPVCPVDRSDPHRVCRNERAADGDGDGGRHRAVLGGLTGALVPSTTERSARPSARQRARSWAARGLADRRVQATKIKEGQQAAVEKKYIPAQGSWRRSIPQVPRRRS